VAELAYASDSKSDARKGVRVRVPPPAPFLDNLLSPPVTWAVAWGCSSAGRAQGWQSWGQGFESPQLHHFFLITSRTRLRLTRCSGCAGVASGGVQSVHCCPVGARNQVTVNAYRDFDGVVAQFSIEPKSKASSAL
jgi:hypothetical protein